ncbi:MAG: hypothetical protein E3J25_01790 [Anaerolineales bacterium]|nr:MAG: hypothetical protein E3J25_01790 [Anaerolineales bacterium]
MPLTPIIDRVQAICTSIVSQDVVLNPPTPGECYTWHEITGINRTAGTTTIEVGLKHGTEFFAYRCAAAAALDRSVRLQTSILAPGEFVPCARFKVAALGDLLELVVNGHCGHI